MKQILTLLMFVVIACNCYSQFSAGMHIGASDKNALVGMHTQYQFNNRFTAGINLTSHADNSNPAYFQSRFGFVIGNYRTGLSIQPYTGYSFSIQNMEKNNYGGSICFGTQVRYQITDIAMLYSDINMPSSKMVLISFGIAGRLPLRYECK